MQLSPWLIGVTLWSIVSCIESNDKADKVDTTNDIKLPDPLTGADFTEVTSQHLTFVEFFSPFCSHCKELAPTWEKTYKEFYPELKELDVEMRQVNCIESGDLCEQEDITSYPNLRIYAPVHDPKTGKKIGKLKYASLYPRSLVRTKENFKKFVRNSVAEYANGDINLSSASKTLNLDDLLKFISGDIEQPEFVMFYPGTQKQWAVSESTGRSAFHKTCYDCLDNKKMWDKLSNQVLTTIGTHHFSCQDNKQMCNELGFKPLAESFKNPSPQFVMFLPKSAGIIRFDFKGFISLEALKKFALDLYENYRYENVSAKTLSEIMEFRKTLPSEPLNQYQPLPNKVSVVFYHDPATVTDEDKDILPYLLEFITYSPFNMYLYVAKSDKFERAINTQASSLIDYINYDESQEAKVFNKALHLATTLTTKPTLFIIKDNTLFTSVYQHYAPEELRNKDKLYEFLNKNQHPLYQELNSQLIPVYFDEKNGDKQDKVVVTFIDSSNAKLTDEILYDISLAAHEYHHTKNEYYFNDILDKRDEKRQIVEALKKQNADSVTIIKEMRRKIPHLFDNNQVLFTFVDLEENRQFADIQGWNINSKVYSPGDTIVATKDNSRYWDQDLEGNQLKSDPKIMRLVLKFLLDPKLVPGQGVKLNSHLVASPYGTSLRFMDQIHQKGFLGYLLVIAVIVGLISAVRRIRKQPQRLSTGILGGKHD